MAKRPRMMQPAGSRARTRKAMCPDIAPPARNLAAPSKGSRLMATFQTSIVVTAQDQASGILSGIAGNFARVAGSIDASARRIARSTQVAAVQAAHAAAQQIAAPARSAGRAIFEASLEYSKMTNDMAVATSNARDLQERAGMRSEAAIMAQREANMRRLQTSLGHINDVARQTTFNVSEVGKAFNQLNLQGLSEDAARAILPAAAMYAQAAKLSAPEGADSLLRMTAGAYGRPAIQDAARAADLSRHTGNMLVATADVSGADVRQLDQAMRVALPAVIGPLRREWEREAQSRFTDPTERLRYVENKIMERARSLMADAATMIQAGAEGGQAGRALASTESRVGAMTPRGRRFLEANGIDIREFQTLGENAGSAIAAGIARQLPNVPQATRDRVAAIYNQPGISAAAAQDQAIRELAERGGANGGRMTTRDFTTAQRIAREQHDAVVRQVDVQGLYNRLEQKGVNAATTRAALGQHYGPQISSIEQAESTRIREAARARMAAADVIAEKNRQLMADLAGAWARLTESMTGAKIAVGDVFKPAVIAGFKRAEEILDSITSKLNARKADGTWENPGLRDTVKYLGYAAAAAVALVPVLVTIGTAALGIWAVSKAFAAVAATVAAVVKGVGVLVGIFASIPVAIAAVTAALAGWAIFNDLGGSLAPFLSAVQHVKDALASLWEAGKAALSGDWSKAGELAMSALRSIGSGLLSLGESLGKAAMGALSAAWDNAKVWWGGVGQWIADKAKSMESAFDGWMQRAGTAIGDAVSGAFDSAVTTASAAFGRLAQAFNANVVEPIKTAWQSALDWINGAIDRMVARVGAAITSLRERLPSWAGGITPQAPAAPVPQGPAVQVPLSFNAAPPAVSVPQVPLSQNIAPTIPAPDVSPITGAAKAVEGATRDAAGPAGTLAENAAKIAGQAASAASNLDAVGRSLSSLSNLRVSVPTLPQTPAAAAPAAPAAPAQQGAVQPFRSFADQGIDGRPGRVTVAGNVGVDVRVRAEPGSQARTIAQTSGEVRSKIDAGYNDAAWA